MRHFKISYFSLSAAIMTWLFQGAAFGQNLEDLVGGGAARALTLWSVIKSGGSIMIILGALSVLALGLILYFFVALRVSREVPSGLYHRIMAILESGRIEGLKRLCDEADCILCRIVSAGIDFAGHDRLAVREAMESEGARQASLMWQRLAYLSDIAVISPMLGILGTVVGMIQGFNAVAADVGHVRPILLAQGISKALVTTAGGLIVAIPVLAFYVFFRGRVQRIVIAAETASTRIVDRIATLRTPS